MLLLPILKAEDPLSLHLSVNQSSDTILSRTQIPDYSGLTE